MPLTLYRYIAWELFKLLALSTTVLVLVISFAATIKPLSDGLLSPWAMVKFIGYTAPTMLTFALPFSGAFAATLLFIRLASDNEVQACAASGISYRSILFPVAAIGLALTMGLFFMANYVIPGFYRGAARTIEADVMTMLVGRLNEDQA
ncbi:MAG: LptF/LptG family permease, partial [Planctomycetota bacterium]